MRMRPAHVSISGVAGLAAAVAAQMSQPRGGEAGSDGGLGGIAGALADGGEEANPSSPSLPPEPEIRIEASEIAALRDAMATGTGYTATLSDGTTIAHLSPEAVVNLVGEIDQRMDARRAEENRKVHALSAAQRSRAAMIAQARKMAQQRSDMATRFAHDKRERIARRNRQNATGIGGKLRRLGVEVSVEGEYRITFAATARLSADTVEALLVDASPLDYAGMWNLSPEVIRSIEA